MDVIAGKRKVACEKYAYPARHDMPPGQGDGRLRTVQDFLDQGPIIGWLEGQAALAGAECRLQVCTCTEHPVAHPAQRDDPDRRVPGSRMQRLPQSPEDAGIKRVRPIGPVPRTR
ncbi:MAG: hypothetical protein H6Q05_2674 [Acidobacteria bacterium]|nr:hypothetical protein [Acidobacteriota bacterium]